MAFYSLASEFSQLLSELGASFSENELNEAIQQLDTDSSGNNSITYNCDNVNIVNEYHSSVSDNTI